MLFRTPARAVRAQATLAAHPPACAPTPVLPASAPQLLSLAALRHVAGGPQVKNDGPTPDGGK